MPGGNSNVIGQPGSLPGRCSPAGHRLDQPGMIHFLQATLLLLTDKMPPTKEEHGSP